MIRFLFVQTKKTSLGYPPKKVINYFFGGLKQVGNSHHHKPPEMGK